MGFVPLEPLVTEAPWGHREAQANIGRPQEYTQPIGRMDEPPRPSIREVRHVHSNWTENESDDVYIPVRSLIVPILS